MKKYIVILFFMFFTSLVFGSPPMEIDQWGFTYWIIQESSLEVSYSRTKDTSVFNFLYSEDPVKLTADEAKALADVFSNSESVFAELSLLPQGEKDFKIGNNIVVTLGYSKKEGRQIQIHEKVDMYSTNYCRVSVKYLKTIIPFLLKADEIEQYFNEKLVFE